MAFFQAVSSKLTAFASRQVKQSFFSPSGLLLEEEMCSFSASRRLYRLFSRNETGLAASQRVQASSQLPSWQKGNQAA
jgi:hypothetical protein